MNNDSRRSLAEKRIAILGVGLIGGSLGMAWRQSGAAREIIGVDPASGEEAVRAGAVDRLEPDAATACAEAEVVVLAAPVRTIIAQAQTLGPLIRPGTIVTDVGSTKSAVVEAWEQYLAPGAFFVGGHPLFGREVGGVTNARSDLAARSRYVLTYGTRSTPDVDQMVVELVKAAGATALWMTPADHDQRVAFSSHLPQAVATALGAAVLEADQRLGGVLHLGAGGLKDTTRKAASPPDIWNDIFMTNQDALLEALGLFRSELQALEEALRTSDEATISRIFANAQEARRRLL